MRKQFKISIHISIMTLFAMLLTLIGLSIIIINYVAFNHILSTSAKKQMEKTSLLVKERINMYLSPLTRNLIQASNAINRGIINPDNPAQFDKFLFESIRYNREIFMVYYGNKKGDFYGGDRERLGIIVLTHIMNSKKPAIKVRYDLSVQGEKVIKKQNINTSFDPRERPWYQEAIKVGKPIWTDIYNFVLFEKNNEKIYGITAAAPIYGKNNQLKGVFALDLTVDGIQRFIQELDITKNTLIYITDDKKQVIAYRHPDKNEDIRGQTLKKIHLPLMGLQDKQDDTMVRTYQHENQDYFMVHEKITGNDIAKPWYITLIVPINDVLGPLKKVSLQALIITLIILILGTFIARYISQKISRPIIKLAEDAKEITKLNLSPPPHLNSWIKEINLMDTSLKNMRSSLASFQRYVPTSLVKKLIISGKLAKVGGQNQRITVLFSDIKNFTQLSENTTPKKLILYLSNYFQSMTESIINHHGTIDKYIGDAIMALWNAPEFDSHHPLHACQAAVDMIERVHEMNKKNSIQEIPALSIRIGINSGEAIVGNVGSDDRLNFTALGDEVNLASRLENINKNYHTQIIVSESTYEQVKNHFSFRPLDKVVVRGKHQSTTIYELVITKNISQLEQHKQEFAQAFTLYQQGHWDKSLALFQMLTPAYPGDRLGAIYIKRCQKLIKLPPSNWDGVWRS